MTGACSLWRPGVGGDFDDPDANTEVNQTVGFEASEQEAIDLMKGFAAQTS